MVIVQIDKIVIEKRPPPSPPRTNVGLKSEMQTWPGTNDHQHWFGGGGGGVIFNLQKEIRCPD